MISWIIDNIATIIVCIVLILMIAAIIANMMKKNGKRSCGCNCGGCDMNCSRRQAKK